jgi:hypothetical protein
MKENYSVDSPDCPITEKRAKFAEKSGKLASKPLYKIGDLC